MSASVRGLLCVGLMVQLLVRARHRVDRAPGLGWEGVLERLELLADLVADRAVIEALPRTDLRGMFQRLLNRWPAKEDLAAEPPQPLLALLSLAEAILGETRDEVVPRAANLERQLEPAPEKVECPVADPKPMSAEERMTSIAMWPEESAGYRCKRVDLGDAIAMAEANAAAAVAAERKRCDEAFDRVHRELVAARNLGYTRAHKAEAALTRALDARDEARRKVSRVEHLIGEMGCSCACMDSRGPCQPDDGHAADCENEDRCEACRFEGALQVRLGAKGEATHGR